MDTMACGDAFDRDMSSSVVRRDDMSMNDTDDGDVYAR